MPPLWLELTALFPRDEEAVAVTDGRRIFSAHYCPTAGDWVETESGILLADQDAREITHWMSLEAFTRPSSSCSNCPPPRPKSTPPTPACRAAPGSISRRWRDLFYTPKNSSRKAAKPQRKKKI
ncbi:MAG: hypothetical protein JO295_03655 [Verrucomicrobia bacterium]|nr:hypothetical protein [Verrucomicrobiota bacterium]